VREIVTALILSTPCVLGGCDSSGSAVTSAPLGSASAPTVSPRAPKRRPRRAESPLLGPDERRVFVFVLPGDAQVEIDGHRVSRRDGVVELVGKPGEKRTLTAWTRDDHAETITVTIEAGGASPSLLNLNDPKPEPKVSAAKAVKFDVDE